MDLKWVLQACEHGDDTLSGSINGGEFLDQMRDYQSVNGDYPPWSYICIYKHIYSFKIVIFAFINEQVMDCVYFVHSNEMSRRIQLPVT